MSIQLEKIDKQSKGRNGWFHPHELNVLHGPHNTLALEVWSRNKGGEPPIDLYLTHADAVALANAILGAVRV